MYKITKRMEISSSHILDLPYKSPCQNEHGHNWIITIEITHHLLDCSGMVVDFSHIEDVVNRLDHTCLNRVIGFSKGTNPTAENIAAWVCRNVQSKISELWEPTGYSSPTVSKVTVQESEGNEACYIP